MNSGLTPRRAAAGLAAILWLSSLAAPLAVVQACSCSWLGGTEQVALQAMDEADVAFVGTVTASAPVFGFNFEQMGPEIRYTFDVERASIATEGVIDVRAIDDGGGASCGFTFDVGDRWLVAAVDDDGALRTHLCSGNTSLAGDDADMADRLLAHLPFAPVAANDEATPGAFVRNLPAAIALVVLLAATVATVVIRRRERPS
jgi:hypothetical protein